MLITSLEGFVPISDYILNDTDPKVMRILWLQRDTTWARDSTVLNNHSLIVENYPTPILMIDTTVIGMN